MHSISKDSLVLVVISQTREKTFRLLPCDTNWVSVCTHCRIGGFNVHTRHDDDEYVFILLTHNSYL